MNDKKRGLIRFVVSLLAPFILVFSGAGVAALGYWLGWPILIWTGLIVAVITIIFLCVYTGSSLFD